MKREFFCAHCGLFFWEESNYDFATNNGRPYSYECHFCTPDAQLIYAVDTFGFAYFCESEFGKEALKKKWSSSEYASETVLEIYKHQGFELRDLPKAPETTESHNEMEAEG